MDLVEIFEVVQLLNPREREGRREESESHLFMIDSAFSYPFSPITAFSKYNICLGLRQAYGGQQYIYTWKIENNKGTFPSKTLNILLPYAYVSITQSVNSRVPYKQILPHISLDNTQRWGGGALNITLQCPNHCLTFSYIEIQGNVKSS